MASGEKFHVSRSLRRSGFGSTCSYQLFFRGFLSHGEEDFQRKCLAKMEEFQKEGHTIIFASHSLPIVLKLCNRALWLDHGRVKAIGPAPEVVAGYVESVSTGG